MLVGVYCRSWSGEQLRKVEAEEADSEGDLFGDRGFRALAL